MSTFTQGYALLIGIDSHSIPHWSLPAVAKDIVALQEVLIHPTRCGYIEEHVRVLQGKDATRSGILAGLAWLKQQLKVDTTGNATALIYYSGHGWRNATGTTYCLVPYDTEAQGGQPILATALRADEVAELIAALPAKRLLVALDCCHAAGLAVKDLDAFASATLPVDLFLTPRDESAMEPAAGSKGLEQLAVGAGRAILNSAQADQKSYIRKDRKMSIFTYHLIEALTGHAQPQSGADEVLVSDILSYLHRTVAASAQAQYHLPQQPDYRLTGNFPVALLLGGKGLDGGQAAPDPLAPLPATPATYQATNSGSGAIAQGGAVAAGERGVAIGGDARGNQIITGDGNRVDQQRTTFDQRGQRVKNQHNFGGEINTGGGGFNTGTVNTGGGAYIGGSVSTGGGDFVGRDKIVGAAAGQTDLVVELQKLHAALTRAGAQGLLDEESVIDVDGALQKALRQAEQSTPDHQTIRRHLLTAQGIVESAGGAASLGGQIAGVMGLLR